jgi:phosphatidylglycerophosphatase A
MTRLLLLLAAGFGAGFSPWAPGTVGTLTAIPVYLLFVRIPFPLHELTATAFLFLAVAVAGRAQAFWGKKDDRRIVIDEMAGYLVAMLWIEPTLLSVTLGFLLFRLFDITKPWPIRRLEELPGGFGVVLDDILAGVYANLFCRLILWGLPWK